MMTKEKPIIFSGLSIPAILNLKPNVWPPEPIDPGKPWKWQTRRIVKDDIVNGFDIDIDGKVIAYIDQATGDSYKPEEICPYPPGTRLWVRETWQKNYWNEAMVPNKYAYKASPETWIYFSEEEKRLEKKWRPSIHMPREAARIFLRVKTVRVERLQDITEEQAVKEGAKAYGPNNCSGTSARIAFAEIWDRTTRDNSYEWRKNPWVWVIEFERINKE